MYTAAATIYTNREPSTQGGYQSSTYPPSLNNHDLVVRFKIESTLIHDRIY